MESTLYSIYLGINYHTMYGEDVYVVGNIPELGNWNLWCGFRLNYFEGGNWTNALKLKKQDKIIEYKYVVYNQWQNKAIWEDGPNRVLKLSSVKKRETFNIEVWNHREVCIRIKYDCEPRETLAICGDSSALGNWKYPSKMDIVIKKDPQTGKRTTFWQKIFTINPYIERVKYRFVLLREDEDQNIWEREPSRVCNFVTLTTTSPSKKYETLPNRKDSIKFYKKQNRYIKYDCNFVSELYCNWITENIIIGPYPQNESEIEYLSKQGVKAVLNLQTKHDMKYRSTQWKILEQNYFISNIKAINLAIVDMCIEDIFLKAYSYAVFLNELVEKYKKVYVHCTAGRGRAPHVVAVYLMFFKGYKVEEAIALVKEKRPLAYLNRELLLRIYNKYKQKNSLNNGVGVLAEKSVFLNVANRTIKKEMSDMIKDNGTSGEVNVISQSENVVSGFRL